MPTDAPLLWIVAALAAAALALIQTARIAFARWARRRALRVRFSRAAEGEHRAEPLLRRAGYEILDRQVRGAWTLRADGQPMAVQLRADLLVAKGGRRYIAEVKTGKLAPRLDHAPTRRQLLEYRVAFDVDGVLLVDAESNRVVEVELEPAPSSEPTTSEPPRWSVPLALGISVGVAVGLAIGFGLGAR